MINISYLTGKCDCYDTLVEIHQVTDFSNVKIYAANNDLIPLRIDSQKDLMPYYPYLISSMSKGDGEISVHLSSKSYIDQEEEKRLTWKLNALKKYYRKCKRDKVPFDVNEAAKKIDCFGDTPQAYETELINCVSQLGNEATIEDIHIPYFDKKRKDLYEAMLKAGWTQNEAFPWVFGWRRWFTASSGLLDNKENNDV